MPTANSWAAALSPPDDDAALAKRKRGQSMGQLLMQRASSSEPVYGTGQGLAKVAAGAIGGYMERLDDDKERAGQKALADAVLGVAGGGAGPAPSFGMGGGKAPSFAGGDRSMRMPADPAIEQRFIGTLRAGGLTNPNGLAAVGAYANAESGYSPNNISGSWADPSQSGQPGTSGGILSWRAERLAAMKAATAGAADPVSAQAKFFLTENPQVTMALQNAGSPEEANAIMARAWRFAGYDQPGGENARRLDMTRSYLGRVGSGDGASQQVASAPVAASAPQAAGDGAPVMSAPMQDPLGSGQPITTAMMPRTDGGWAPVPPARPQLADMPAQGATPAGQTAMGDQDGFTAAPGGFMIPPGPQVPAAAGAPPAPPQPAPDGGTMLPGITVDGPPAPPLPPPRPADIGAAVAGGASSAAAPLPPPRPDFADMPAPGSAPAALQVTPDLSNTRDAGALSFATGVPTASNTGMPSLAAAVANPAQGGAPAAGSPQRLAQLVAGGASAPAAPVSDAGGAPSAMPASAAPGGNRGAALAAIISSPYASDGMKTWALGQINPKLEHVDLGDAVGLVGPNGQVVGRIAKTKAADFGVVGKDAYGNESYGYRNYGDQSVRPTSPASSAPPTDMNGAPVPAGVDPKVVRDTQSRSYAGGTVPADAKDVSEVRKEVLSLPSYKNIKQASPVYRAMISTAGTDSKASDLNLIYGLGKIMDPNSVVREGELALANGTAGIEDRLVGFAKSVFGGARLTPETRAALLAEAHGRMKAYEDEYTVDADHYRGIAGRNRMNSDDVVPRFEPMKAWEPPAKAGAAPDRAAIEAEARRRGLVK